MKIKNLQFLILFGLIASFAACGGGSSDDKSTNLNQNGTLIEENNNFDTSSGWGFIDYRGYSLEDSIKPDFYDPDESYDSGTGSAYLEHSGDKDNRNDRLYSEFSIPVTAGNTYTLSFWMKTKSWPSPSIQVFGTYLDIDGKEIANSDGSRTSNSKKDLWEKTYIIIPVPNNADIKSFEIRIVMNLNDIQAKVWVDEFALTQGVLLPEKPTKTAFNGSITSIDSLGNFNVDGQPFFPLGIFGDKDRVDWNIYAAQGFNTYMWVSDQEQLEKAQTAGLKSAMQVVQYITDTSFGDRLATLSSDLDEILASDAAESLLFYYIDNEFYDLKSALTDTVNTIRQKDNGKRPIYMLNGDYALARKYNDLSDITGAYVAKDGTTIPTIDELVIQDRQVNQKQPSAFAQINAGVGKNFRPILFGAIAKGAKAASFWKDGGSTGTIENRLWWDDLPAIKSEIETMLTAGLIQADHNPTFKITSNNKNIISGTRVVDGTGYIIAANPTQSDINVTFELQNLGYTASTAENFFTNDTIDNVDTTNVTILIPKHGSSVIKLNK